MSWIKKFGADEIRSAMEEACIDCYDPEEQSNGLFHMLDQELAFPFPATVIGETVEVVSVTSAKFDSLGIDVIVRRKKKEYAVAATSITPAEPLPDGAVYLAAFLDWKRMQ